MSHYSTEDFEDYVSDYDTDSYESSFIDDCESTKDDTESLCSNDSYESSFIDDCESTEDDTEDEFYLK